MEMNQYSAVINRLNLIPPATSAQAPNTTEAPAASSAASVAEDVPITVTGEAVAAEPFVTPEETGTKPKTSTKESEDAEELIRKMDCEKNKEPAVVPLSEEQMEIRRRRLEKFGAPKDESPQA